MSTEILFPNPDRRPYYIAAPDYAHESTGARVLHLLCHLLNLRGQCAFVTSRHVNCDWVAPVLTEAIVLKHFEQKRTPIVIYPETVIGNPLNATCIVRYLLNYSGSPGGLSAFPSHEKLLWYSKQMKEESKAGGHVLSFPATDTQVFSPPPAEVIRRGSCFYGEKARAFSGGGTPAPPEESIEILKEGPGVQAREELVRLFRASEVFYCYENSSLSLDAALCGCPVALMPNSHYTQPILFEPVGLTGMAWGDSPEELERARRTVSQVPEKYEAWIENGLRQLDLFIEDSQTDALRTPYPKKIRIPFFRRAAKLGGRKATGWGA